MSTRVIIIGGGGHARVLIDALQMLSVRIDGIAETDPSLLGRTLMGVPVVPEAEILRQMDSGFQWVNGIGSVRTTSQRQAVFERFKQAGCSFMRVIHPSAVIAKGVDLGEGVQVMAGAVIQTGVVIGQDSIVNTGAILDHDCRVGKHVHIAPGATLSGAVSVEDLCHIGTGATVIQQVTIGRAALVAAGACVVKNVRPGMRVQGIPAKEFFS
jgi:sugar O-acyltransferase (sialic acid O-acetyltransferase NeuD family)